MAYTSSKHGRADYGSWCELSHSQIAALTGQEGDGSLPLAEQKFGKIVWVANPTQIQLSGGLIVNSTIIDSRMNEGFITPTHEQFVIDYDLIDLVTLVSGDLHHTMIAIDSLSADFDALNTALQNIQGSVQDLSGNIDGVKISVDNLSGDLQTINTSVKAVETAVMNTSADFSVMNSYIQLLQMENEYSRRIQSLGTDVYIAKAVPGSDLGESVWRIEKIDSSGSRQWANGASTFINPASGDLSGLVYSY